MEDRHDWLLESRSDRVVTLQLNYPQRRNAFTIPMRLALIDALQRAEKDADVSAIVLTGGTATFCSGGDVSTMGAKGEVSWRERLLLASEVAVRIARNSKPVIAAVEGWAVGAGLSLAMLCDTVVAGNDARFKTGFSDVGMIGDIGLLHTLPARVGTARAKQLLFYGEVVEAAEAHRIGLVDHLAESGQSLAAAHRLASTVARKGPRAVEMTKTLLAEGLEPLLVRERATQEFLAGTADHLEGMAAFMEKRAPRFTGR